MDDADLILRCSMLIGDTMKKNHITKIINNETFINLSKDSEFNYILMSDLKDFFINKNHNSLSGIYDFVANDSLKLSKVLDYFKSSTELGNYTYVIEHEYKNPIYKKFNNLNKSSIKNLQIYYGK
jgi:hypothetical protein